MRPCRPTQTARVPPGTTVLRRVLSCSWSQTSMPLARGSEASLV